MPKKDEVDKCSFAIFCEEPLPPQPPTLTVMHQTIGGKGVVARIEKQPRTKEHAKSPIKI